jgi:transglutaminase-like putative cysteine protease
METWGDIGAWYADLARGRRDPSPQLKQKVAELTADAPTLLAKMQALAAFVQDDIRYVAIELGIGGFQPHTAADVLRHEYGDCKDKATLLRSAFSPIQ